MCVHYGAHMENFESWFSFCHVGSQDRTQVVGLDDKHLYPMSHLVVPPFFAFLMITHISFFVYLF